MPRRSKIRLGAPVFVKRRCPIYKTMDTTYRQLQREDSVPYHVHLRRGWEPEEGDQHGPLSILEAKCAECNKTGLRFSDCCLCESCGACHGDHNSKIVLWHRRNISENRDGEIGPETFDKKCACSREVSVLP